MSGASTRRFWASAGMTRRQLAQAVTPGPEPWISSSGKPLPCSSRLVRQPAARIWRPSSGLGSAACGGAFRDAVMAASEFHADVFQLGVELQRVHTPFAADARLLAATEGGAQVAQEPAVDPDDAGLDLPGDAVGARAVLGPDRRRQAIRQAVGQLDGLLVRVERADMAAGAEDFLGDHRRIVGEASPDGRLHPGAAGQVLRHVRHTAAGDDSGAVIDCLLVIAEDFFAVLEADQRAEVD